MCSDVGAGVARKRVDLEAFVLEYLLSHDTVKPSDIEGLVAQSKQTISNRLRIMGEQGLLEKIPSGRGYTIWRLTQEPLKRRISLLCEGFKADLENEVLIPLRAADINNETHLLDDVVDDWLDSGERLLVLLGDYGSGKTLFSKQLYIRLAQKYLEDSYYNRMPVLIQLKRLLSDKDPIANLTDRGHIYGPVPANDELYNMNAEGKILFILDGFDEMPVCTGSTKPHKNFMLLNKFFTDKSKVVLTSRTAYFKRQLEEERVCSLQDNYSTGFLFETQNGQNAITYIQDLSQKDIDTYLKEYYGKHWKRKRTKMDSIYDLSDLAKRPILLNVICQTLPKLAKRDVEINILEIYTAYVDMWLEREKWKDINEDDVRQFMMELALYMSKNGDYEIHYTELKKKISKSLSGRIFSYYELEDFDNKIRTCTFLHRDPEGNYSFMHRSFMEYFVAMGIQEAFESSTDADHTNKIIRGILLDTALLHFLEQIDVKCPSCGNNVKYLQLTTRSTPVVGEYGCESCGIHVINGGFGNDFK